MIKMWECKVCHIDPSQSSLNSSCLNFTTIFEKPWSSIWCFPMMALMFLPDGNLIILQWFWPSLDHKKSSSLESDCYTQAHMSLLYCIFSWSGSQVVGGMWGRRWVDSMVVCIGVVFGTESTKVCSPNVLNLHSFPISKGFI